MFILPTVRINHAQYRGKLAYSEVLKAICAGFTKNNEPDVCLRVAEDDCREGSAGDRECKNRYAKSEERTCMVQLHGATAAGCTYKGGACGGKHVLEAHAWRTCLECKRRDAHVKESVGMPM